MAGKKIIKLVTNPIRICEECESRHRANNLTLVEDVLLCKECVNSLTSYCYQCDQLFLKANLKNTVDGQVCEACLESYIECVDCGNVIQEDDSSYSDITSECYCPDCYDEKFTCCYSCEEEIRRSYSFGGVDGHLYCESCHSERFGECSDCGEVYFWDDLRSDGDYHYCGNCYSSNSYIRDYNYTPRLCFNKLVFENTLYLGIELEVECDDPRDKAEDFTNYLESLKIDDKFYLKNDASVEGFEIVSHPCTISYIHKNIQFKKILEYLRKNDFTSYNNGECGLHIHLSRNFFTDLEKRKLRLFFANNRHYIELFANRNGKNTSYCLFESQVRSKNIIRGELYPSGRGAINFRSSQSTIELRAFRGTLNYKRFQATLQFADSLAHFVKDHSILSQNWFKYIDWLIQINRYGQLVKYLQEKKLK